MIYIKTDEEIRAIREGGKRLNKILNTLIKAVKPGLASEELEFLALKLIKQAGGAPAFKDYPLGDDLFFPAALCLSINEEIVHGSPIPSRDLKNGDIVDLDIGMEWPVLEEDRRRYNLPKNPHSKFGGFFTDMCGTVPVGSISKEAKKLLRITKESLYLGIAQAKVGNNLNDIARAIESLAIKNNYGVVRDLVGHGIGYFAHEEPNVFNYEIKEGSAENIVLEPGLVIAIEPMFNIGDWRIKMDKNDYTFLSRDNSLSAHFEHTVAITKNGPQILTLA